MLAQGNIHHGASGQAGPRCDEHPPRARVGAGTARNPCRDSFPSIEKEAVIMVTTELGACEWFVWDLRRSNLIDRGQLDQVVSEFLQTHPRAEPASLAEYLVTQDILSQFQDDRLLQGNTQGLVLGSFTPMNSL